MITYQNLVEILEYSAETGLFKWKKKISNRCSDVVGTKTENGYISIRINNKSYRAHRLAWLYVYKEMPNKFIDHINRVRDDNRIENLRLATQKQNNENRINTNKTTGIRGVFWDKERNKFASCISQNNKTIALGRYNTLKEAETAYKQAAKKLHTFNNSI